MHCGPKAGIDIALNNVKRNFSQLRAERVKCGHHFGNLREKTRDKAVFVIVVTDAFHESSVMFDMG